MTYQFDAVDINILNMLQKDARLNHKEIADKLSKSLNTIYNRVRRMEEEGIIKSYVALLDNAKVHRAEMFFTHVKLKDHSREGLSNFENEIIKADEVMECYHMTGKYDFILKVATESVQLYHDFLMKKLFTIMSVGSVETTLVMRQAKFETAYVIDVTKAK